MNNFLLAWKSYGIFSGRSRRAEFWFFQLYNFIFLFLFNLIDYLLNTQFKGEEFGYFFAGYAAISFLPNLAVTVRRLHDRDKSGWWILIGLTGIGHLYLLYLLVLDSLPGDNRFGSNPKSIIV